MALNKKKVLRSAEKYTSKRQWDKAIAEYEKLSQEDYGESSLQNIIGDLYLNKGDVQRAVEYFEQAAEFYERDGFVPKSIAMFRKILRLDPTLSRHYHKLAQLYSDQGLVQDAIAQLQTLAQYHERHLQVEKALATYQQIAELDPTNIAIRIKMGELCERQGMKEEGVRQYVLIGEAYARKGEIGGSYTYFKKAATIQPENLEAQRGLATVYLSTGQADRAIETWKKILSLQPDDIPALFSLGKVLLQEGRQDEALPVFERISELDPKKEGVQEIIGRIYIQKGDYEEAFQRLEPVIDAYLEEELFEESIKMLQQLVERAPKSIQIRHKIAELFRRLGMDERAYLEYQQIAEILIENGNLSEAVKIYEQLFVRNPENEIFKARYEEVCRALGKTPIMAAEGRAQEPLDAVLDSTAFRLPSEVAEKIQEAGPAAEPAAVEPGESIGALTAGQREKVEEYHVEVDVFIKYGLLDNAINRLKEVVQLDPQDLNAYRKLHHLYEKQGRGVEAIQSLLSIGHIQVQRNHPQKALEVYKEVLEQDPANGEALSQIEQLNAQLFGTEEDTVSGLEVVSAAEESSHADAISELSDFAQQIFQDPAKEEEEPSVVGSEAPVGAPDLAPSGVQFMDDSATDVDVSEVVRVFRDGLEKQISSKDFETHYNLGIAYREMGLIDEAIREFALVMEFPEMVVEGTANLGLCYIDTGEFEKAVDVLERGLALVGDDVDKRIGLSYDLAQAYRMAGQRDQALAILVEIDRIKKGFRDVAGEIQRLQESDGQV